MDESTLRFFEELGNKIIALYENGMWDVVEVDEINKLFDKHLPLLRYEPNFVDDLFPDVKKDWELRIGGKREE